VVFFETLKPNAYWPQDLAMVAGDHFVVIIKDHHAGGKVTTHATRKDGWSRIPGTFGDTINYSVSTPAGSMFLPTGNNSYGIFKCRKA